MQYKHDPYFKDSSGYIASMSEWIDMLHDARDENPYAFPDMEEYIAKLTPMAKVDGQWQEMDK